MRRLIFVNRFFFPDHSATSQILSDLAFHLAGSGRRVDVVTSAQIYDAPKAALPASEAVRGVGVHRVASTRFGRRGLAGRSIDYLSFYRSVWRRLLRMAQPGDLIVAKTDPPLVSIVAGAAAARTGAGLINWLQDLYPEVAVELGVPLVRGPVAGNLARRRDRSLLAAEANVVVGRLMAERVAALGVTRSAIHVIPNWVDDGAIRPIAPADNALRRSWGLAGKFVLGYSGNLGRAHEFETVLAAAELLRDDPRIVFVMIGGGKRFEELRAAVKARRLDRSFRFMPYQERERLAESLGVPDVHWLSLNAKLEGLLVPSKFYGIAAAGRPIIVIGNARGELARPVQEHKCGLVVETNDSAALAAALRRLADEPETVAAMGARARNMLEAGFSRQRAIQHWCSLIDRLDRLRDAESGRGGTLPVAATTQP